MSGNKNFTHQAIFFVKCECECKWKLCVTLHDSSNQMKDSIQTKKIGIYLQCLCQLIIEDTIIFFSSYNCYSSLWNSGGNQRLNFGTNVKD